MKHCPVFLCWMLTTFPKESQNIKSKIGSQSSEASENMAGTPEACQSAGMQGQSAEGNRGRQSHSSEGQQETGINS